MRSLFHLDLMRDDDYAGIVDYILEYFDIYGISMLRIEMHAKCCTQPAHYRFTVTDFICQIIKECFAFFYCSRQFSYSPSPLPYEIWNLKANSKSCPSPWSRRDGHHCYAFHRLNAKVTEWHASECNIHEVNLCKTKKMKAVKKKNGGNKVKKQKRAQPSLCPRSYSSSRVSLRGVISRF